MISDKNNKRIESVRMLVQQMVFAMDSTVRSQEAIVQLYGVSTFASLLAMKRGQNQELAAIAGLLHNYYFYKTGMNQFHGNNSAEAVRPLLRDLKIFTDEELITILRAIFYHEDNIQVHSPFEEIVKDAYELQLYFQKPGFLSCQSNGLRLRNVLNELIIIDDIKEELHPRKVEKTFQDSDKRNALADIAEALAGLTIIGVPGDERYREICSYWPDKDIYKGLQNSWCAAFVYYCCSQVVFLLPIRYPNGIYRFAGVGAWLEWAQLPETGFMYYDNKDGFTPQRGDIVIYEKLLTEDSHDHIGIILDCNDIEILVAEGNRDNQNYSCVFNRARNQCILGYIRIDNAYVFHFNGSYDPVI